MLFQTKSKCTFINQSVLEIFNFHGCDIFFSNKILILNFLEA